MEMKNAENKKIDWLYFCQNLGHWWWEKLFLSILCVKILGYSFIRQWTSKQQLSLWVKIHVRFPCEVALVDFSLDTSVFELRKEKNRIPIKYVTIRVLPNHFLMICTPPSTYLSNSPTEKLEDQSPINQKNVKQSKNFCYPHQQSGISSTWLQPATKTFSLIKHFWQYIFFYFFFYILIRKKKLYILHTGGPCFKRILFMWSHSTWALNFNVRKFILHETAQNTKFV